MGYTTRKQPLRRISSHNKAEYARNRVTVAGFLKPRDGYGYGTLKIIKALGDVPIMDLGQQSLSENMRWDIEGPVIAVCTPDWLPFIHTDGPVIAHTMFETSKLPEGWVEKLNRYATRVVVPCAWNVEVFRANGVAVPIDIAPWGIDTEDYWPVQRRCDRPYTFLWSGTPDLRKGWDVAYKAFKQAFGNSDKVRLVLHFRKLPRGLEGVRDDNVELLVGLFFRPRLRQLLQDVDCFVFPSRGEGWGLPPREAAATGLPVIATNWGGLAEEIDAWGLPIRVAGTSPAQHGFWDDVGEWVEPDVNEVAHLMAWCHAYPLDAAEFGSKAAAWLARHGTWARTAAALLESVERAGNN